MFAPGLIFLCMPWVVGPILFYEWFMRPFVEFSSVSWHPSSSHGGAMMEASYAADKEGRFDTPIHAQDLLEQEGSGSRVLRFRKFGTH